MYRHASRILKLRRRTYELLEHGPASDRASLIIDRFLVLLIITNLAVVILESVPSLLARYRIEFTIVELFSLVVFSAEYFLRVWVAPHHGKLSTARARMKFITSPVGIIDLLAVLPFWFAFAVPEDLRVILVLRIVRFLKLARYSPGLHSLLEALSAERRALIACLVIFLGATCFRQP